MEPLELVWKLMSGRAICLETDLDHQITDLPLCTSICKPQRGGRFIEAPKPRAPKPHGATGISQGTKNIKNAHAKWPIMALTLIYQTSS